MPDNQPLDSGSRGNLPTRKVTYTEISGPIPPPNVLKDYNLIVPSAAERIIALAEKQSDHRISIEKKVIDSNIRKSYLGMILATVIALYALYVAKEIAIKGNPATAAIIAALDICGLIGVAIYNSRTQKKQRDERRASSSAPPLVQ